MNNNEQYFYLSKTIAEQIKILLPEYTKQRYSVSSQYLREWIGAWRTQLSVDGKIENPAVGAWQKGQEERGGVQVICRPKETIVAFCNIEAIRETRWDNLITEAENVLSMPNRSFKVDADVVKKLAQYINPPHPSILYRGILAACTEEQLEPSVYALIKESKSLAHYQDLQDQPHVRFVDAFTYAYLDKKPKAVSVPAHSVFANFNEEDAIDAKDKLIFDRDL